METTEVAIVGGGPAGAALAIHLARRGIDVVVLERRPTYQWRACGVFSSTAAEHLADLGLDPGDPTLARPLAALRLETCGASPLDFFAAGSDTPTRPVGFDRAVLDPSLLQSARAAGACIRMGSAVTDVCLERDGYGVVRIRQGEESSVLRARTVVGADGVHSVVARGAQARARTPLPNRIGLTFHVAEPPGEAWRSNECARMVVFDGGYCGLCPAPGGRLNVGIVLHGSEWRRAVRRTGAAAVASRVLSLTSPSDSAVQTSTDRHPLDRISGASPLSRLVTRTAGEGWLLVGDASGFTDPFTGEGLGRAFVSAALAADAIVESSRGDRQALDAYATRMRQLFARRDQLSIVLQSFVTRPALLAYALRRLSTREALRRTLELVLAERLAPDRVLAPRFLAALLAP